MPGDVIRLTVAFADGRTLTVTRREAWTLHALVEAGDRGVTVRERPAPRWSGYVLALRRKGVPVETVPETHGGAFPGRHGRYRLAVAVDVVEVVRVGEDRHPDAAARL